MYKIGRWRATALRGGKTRQLGVFQNAKKAALVYDAAARSEYGTNAKVNFDKRDARRPCYVCLRGFAREHQTVEVQPNTKWPRVGDLTRWISQSIAKVAAAADNSQHRLGTNTAYRTQTTMIMQDMWIRTGSLHPGPLPHDADTNISKLWTPVNSI